MDLRVNNFGPQMTVFKGVPLPSARNTVRHAIESAVDTFSASASKEESVEFAGKALERGKNAFAIVKDFMQKLHTDISLAGGQPTTSLFKFVFNNKMGYVDAIPTGEFLKRGDKEGLEAIEFFAEQLAEGKLKPEDVHKKFLLNMFEKPATIDARHMPKFKTKEQALAVARTFAKDTNTMELFEANKDSIAEYREDVFQQLFQKLNPGLKDL